MNDRASVQDSVLAFLGDPATHGGHEVRRIDTHAGIVFLAGDRAFKIKRAVRFPFLDYSTLDQRRDACLAEIEVNRPFAPEVYLRVVPITQTADGRLEIGGRGPAVEWAVEMRRFDENRTLDRLAEQGLIDDALADRLARVVAAAHARAPAVEVSDWLAALETFIDQNAVAFHACPELFARDRAEMLDRETRAALNRLRPLLIDRGRRGLVRRGHGDLHLGNIAMLDDRPVPFDAIEFDPMIAAGDVLYDLAFLLMDLVERHMKSAANRVLNRYLQEGVRPDDLDGLAALPLFMSLRAAIRAKVIAAQLPHVNASQRARLIDKAKAYFDLSLQLLAPARPLLVAIGGLSGTGKTALARALAPDLPPEPGAVLVRSDIERKLLFGVSETDRLPPRAYQADVNAAVYACVASKSARIVAAGHSAIADAVFARSEERRQIAEAAGHARFCGIFLVAGLDTRLERIGRRTGDASDADAAVARAQEQYALNDIDWIRLDASGAIDDILKKARAALASVSSAGSRDD